VSELNRLGWRVATHAVGDAAIDLVLDAYEEANAEQSVVDKRWVIEHGFIPRADHFPRMRELGLNVTAQDHLYMAAPSLLQYWGAERAAMTTPLRTYLAEGIPVSVGTDSPVIPYNPWWVLYHFATRGTISAGVLDTGEAVSVLEALHASTTGNAYLTFEEDEKGTLDPGMFADFTVVPLDPLRADAQSLEDVEPELTVVGGRVVWEKQ
jgi:predicted amidohydrolase YtcJ